MNPEKMLKILRMNLEEVVIKKTRESLASCALYGASGNQIMIVKLILPLSYH